VRVKLGSIVAGAALAIFVIGPIEGASQQRAVGSVAFAEESPDHANVQVDDDEQANDTAVAPDSTSQDDVQDLTTSSASGIYSGTVMDANGGAGEISAALGQTHSQMNGTWQDTFVPPAFWKGTISSSGNIKALMKFHLFGKCGYTFHGVFENGNEISGHYVLSHCKGMAPDSGTLDMIKQ